MRFLFNGNEIPASQGDTVAAALLAAGYHALRSSAVSHQPRGPYCMMGSCYECLVEIDGATAQACQTLVTEGLKVSSAATPEIVEEKVS